MSRKREKVLKVHEKRQRLSWQKKENCLAGSPCCIDYTLAREKIILNKFRNQRIRLRHVSGKKSKYDLGVSDWYNSCHCLDILE